MKGPLFLSWRHMVYHRGQTVILILCIAVSIFLPVALERLTARYNQDLVARSNTTPMLAGTKGNRFDLTLSALYFRESRLDPIPFRQVGEIQESAKALAIPLSVRFTTRQNPLIGVGPEYFDRRELRFQEGTRPLQLGDCVLGSDVARQLGLGVGDFLYSDPKELYDISKPSALKMYVAGIMTPSGSPDDQAVFVDIKTVWILEGFAHGHDEPEEIDESLVIGKTDETIVLSEALIDYNVITQENLQSFHIHGDPDALPLTAILVYPHSDKDGTLLKARFNASDKFQMVVPRKVIDDLMNFVFRIKRLFDSLSAILAGSTFALTALVIVLSLRIRAGEIQTLNRIGCSRHTVFKLYAAELGMILIASLAIAGLGILSVDLFVPDLVRVF